MGSTLNLLYDYTQDLKCLVRKADDLARKETLKNTLSKFGTIKSFGFDDLSLHETEYLVSLSRILADYGFSQTFDSFENACLLLLADYNYTKEAVSMAVEKLKKSASRLYADIGENGVDFLWKAHEKNDPWALLVEMLIANSDEATARRNFYLKRIAELASLESLAGATHSPEGDSVAFRLSPAQLETEFMLNDGILPGILSHHTKKDLY